MTTPVTEWVDPQRFAEWIGHGVSSGLAGRMLANRRLKLRCAELLERRLGSVAPSVIQATALSLDGRGLTRLARQAGATWHAASIVRLIDGTAVRNLIAAIDQELRLFAIRNIALAPPISDEVPNDALPQEIARAGLRCLSAWCGEQPAAVGMRIALRLADHVPPEEPHRTFGPALVDSLLRCNQEPTP